ncbi:MAG: glycosyltransferase [Saprospiraceae bacterium]
MSVVVCARNESEALRRNLPALLAQEGVDYEVVVADDASTDDTAAVLEALGAQHRHLRVARIAVKNRSGKKQALAAAVAAAQGDVLLLTDADCRPSSPRWAAIMTRALCARPALSLALGAAPFFRKKGQWLNAWARFENCSVAARYLLLARMGLPYMGVGRNMAWRKKDWLAAFERAAALPIDAGDDDLCVQQIANTAGVVVAFSPDALAYSSAPTTWRSWFLQKKRHLSASHFYTKKIRLLLGALALTRMCGPLLALAACMGFVTAMLAGALYMIYVAVLIALQGRLFARMGSGDLLWRYPVFDLVMAAYYAVFVPAALWKRTWEGEWRWSAP